MFDPRWSAPSCGASLLSGHRRVFVEHFIFTQKLRKFRLPDIQTMLTAERAKDIPRPRQSISRGSPVPLPPTARESTFARQVPTVHNGPASFVSLRLFEFRRANTHASSGCVGLRNQGSSTSTIWPCESPRPPANSLRLIASERKIVERDNIYFILIW